MTTNAELLAQYRRVLPSFLSPYYAEPISIERGEGSWVWDVEGAKYLDFFGGVLTTMIGHNNPGVTAAIQKQAAKTLHTSSLYLSPPMLDLAEQIAERCGHSRRSGLLHHVRVRSERHCDSAGPPAFASRTRCSRCVTATTAGRSLLRRSPRMRRGRRRRSPDSRSTLCRVDTDCDHRSPRSTDDAYTTACVGRPRAATRHDLGGVTWHA